jgi:hypothetical protein
MVQFISIEFTASPAVWLLSILDLNQNTLAGCW